MFDVNEIFARLQNGDSVEDVATEMTNALNAAEQKFQKEQEKKIAEAAALEKEVELNDLAETMLAVIGEYVSVKCPEAMDAEDIDMEVAEFRRLLDDLIDSYVAMKDLFGEFAPTPFKAPKAESKAPKKLKSADDKIADFLKSMGW